MSFERSRGKLRPTRVRSADLQPVGAVPERDRDHDAQGRFAPGNAGGRGRGWKLAIRRALGVADEATASQLARDAGQVFGSTLRMMPSDAAPVRSILVLHARHLALHGYFASRAEALGLDTPEGLRLVEHAARESQRAERTLVTALDVARACAEHDRQSGRDLASRQAEQRLREYRAEQSRLAELPDEPEEPDDAPEPAPEAKAPPGRSWPERSAVVEAPVEVRQPEPDDGCPRCGVPWLRPDVSLCTSCGVSRPGGPGPMDPEELQRRLARQGSQVR